MRSGRGSVSLATTALLLASPGGVAQAHHRDGSEPTYAYTQPASPPKVGCGTIAADPKHPAGTANAVQVIYAWHAGDGNNYDASVEKIARVVDRVDWAFDESTDYDQHFRLSCRYTPNSTYADYARALVASEQIENWQVGETPSGTVRADVQAAGYNDANRWYLVFTDFESASDATLCFGTGGCVAVVELWDSGVAGHELLHTLGAGHNWATEADPNPTQCPDVMACWWDDWISDPDFNTYYDPSETAASFYIDPWPSTTTWNVARSPALTAPVCCDSGATNDVLTAAERTVESGTPGSAPAGFTAVSGATLAVTPSCGRTGVSCRYYDGRKSLRVTTHSTNAVSGVVVTRNPAATAGRTYLFRVRLRADLVKRVQLRLRWHSSTGGLLGTSLAPEVTTSGSWTEARLSALAPPGTASVSAGIVTRTAQGSFSFDADSLRLASIRPDGVPDLMHFEPATAAWTKLRNEGTGTLTPAGPAVGGLTSPAHAVALDYNRDGLVDLLQFESGAASWMKLRNNGDTTFVHDGVAISGLTTPNAAIAIDYNRDGFLDLMQFEAVNGGIWAKFRNNTDGSFTWEGSAVSGLTTPNHTVVLDYDADGYPDLLSFEAPNGGTWAKFRNNRNGTFSWNGTAVTGLTTPAKVVLLDYNRDGRLDLLDFESTTAGGSWVRLRNEGTGGTFTWDGFAVTGMTTPNHAVVLDYNRDGLPDLLDFEAGNGAAYAKLRNGGAGTFSFDGFAASGLPTPSHVHLLDWR